MLLLTQGRAADMCNLTTSQLFISDQTTKQLNELEQIRSLFCDANFTAFLQELSDEFGISSIIEAVGVICYQLCFTESSDLKIDTC